MALQNKGSRWVDELQPQRIIIDCFLCRSCTQEFSILIMESNSKYLWSLRYFIAVLLLQLFKMIHVIMVSQSSYFHRIRIQGSDVGDIETPISVIYRTLTIICLGMNILCFMKLLTQWFMLELKDVIIYKAKEAAFSVGRRGYYSHFYSIRLKPIKIEKLKPISPCFRFI